MKFTLPLLAAALALASQPITAQAQNLFRTGRPDYARAAPSNSAQPGFAQPSLAQSYASNATNNYWNRPWVSQQYAETNSPSTYDRRLTSRPPHAGSADHDRLQAAWENYRREALRYQQQRRPNDDRPFTANSTSPSYVPLGYTTDWQPLDGERSDNIRRSAGRESLGTFRPDHQCEYRRRLENSQGYRDGYRRSSNGASNRLGASAADRRPTLSPAFRPAQYEETSRDTYRSSPSYQPGRSSQRRPLEPVPMSYSTDKRPINDRARGQLLDPARVASLGELY